MENDTSWTPSPEDNLLGLIDKRQINEIEAKGIAQSELYVFQLDTDVVISTSILLKIHEIAFTELYDWAGKWRTTNIIVGQIEPPHPFQVPQLMYQFIDNLNFKISLAKDK